MAESALNPWSEFRKRWRPLQATIALWVFSLVMLFSPKLEWAWTLLTGVGLLVVLVLLWRIGGLKCPRCEQLFYWPPRLQYRKRRCSHCGLWEYDPYNIHDLSERQYLSSGGA